MALRQHEVINVVFTDGCPGCLDINSGKGGMRGSATHNGEYRNKVESDLRRTKSKRMAAYDEKITERIVKYSEEVAAKKQKLEGILESPDTFVEAEIITEEDVPIEGDDDEMSISDIPGNNTASDPSVWSNLEEAIDTRDKESRRKRVSEEDEEEQARTMKYQVHESEVGDSSERDAVMGSVLFSKC